MAPLPSTSRHMATLAKRNYEMETWRIILGAIGAFLLLGVIGILVGWWRHRFVNRQQQLQAATQKQRGSYAKVEDGRYSLDEIETLNGFRVLRLQRTITTSSDSSSSSSKESRGETEQHTRPGRQTQGGPHHSRSQSLSTLPITIPRYRSGTPYVESTGYSCSVRQSADTYMPLHEASSFAPQILTPPRAAYVEANTGIHSAHDKLQRLTNTRDSSPAPSILSRSISMLRPRSLSLSR